MTLFVSPENDSMWSYKQMKKMMDLEKFAADKNEVYKYLIAENHSMSTTPYNVGT